MFQMYQMYLKLLGNSMCDREVLSPDRRTQAVNSVVGSFNHLKYSRNQEMLGMLTCSNAEASDDENHFEKC